LKIIGIIPARYGSIRFPGKPLILIQGKPMIQHVYERALRSKLIGEVIAATDDMRIYKCVNKFGGKAVMTSKRHKSGTDRIGEIVKLRNSEFKNDDLIVNIQGDEPFIDPGNIDIAIKPLIIDKTLNVSTLCYKITDRSEITDSNVVKIIFDKDNFALYFSRSPIPYNRENSQQVSYYKHIGLYVYRKSYLLKLIELKPTKLERAERLEQLRILESGGKIKVIVTKIDSQSVDTKADLRKFKR